jgi:hypothetical protein
MATLAIENIAGVENIDLEIPDDSGGVIVFRGRNGAGKSACIEISRRLLAGKGKLDCRDGAARGKAEGFGRTVSVTSRTSYRGECESGSLEGRFDFSDLVAPDAKEAETRDRIRIKALLSLTGAKSDPSIFYDLTGGREQFEKLVPAEQVKKAEDLVELGQRVSAALHAEARKKESDAEYAEGHAAACRAAAGDVSPSVQLDLESLHQKVHAATAEHSRLVERRRQAAENEQVIRDAEAKLQKVQEEYTGPGVGEAKERLDLAISVKTAADNEVAKLRAMLDTAEKHAAAAKEAALEARAILERADAYERMLTLLQSQIEQAAGGEDPPSELDLKIAEQASQSARQSLEEAIRQRDAARKAQEAGQYEQAAKQHRHEAERLRELARGVDGVLTTRLPPGPLRAENGRLVLNTRRGLGVPFDECSDGERWRVALPYGIRSVGPGGYLAVVQSAWQDLDSEARREIAALCRESRVWILTAEVADGELRAEEFRLEA